MDTHDKNNGFKCSEGTHKFLPDESIHLRKSKSTKFELDDLFASWFTGM